MKKLFKLFLQIWNHRIKFLDLRSKEYKFKAVPCSACSLYYKIYFKRPGDFLWKICYRDHVVNPSTDLPVIKGKAAFKLMKDWSEDTKVFESFIYLNSSNSKINRKIYCNESSVNMHKALE